MGGDFNIWIWGNTIFLITGFTADFFNKIASLISFLMVLIPVNAFLHDVNLFVET